MAGSGNLIGVLGRGISKDKWGGVELKSEEKRFHETQLARRYKSTSFICRSLQFLYCSLQALD